MTNTKRLLPSLGLVMILSGCGLTNSTYERPGITVPAEWAQSGEQKQTEPKAAWWKTFGDKKLDALIEEALAKNNNLAAAALKVKAARLKANLAIDQYLPDVSGTTNAGRSYQLTDNKAISRSYDATLGVSYEVDLWGKIAAQADSAAWEAAATDEDRAAAALALTGTVAKLYWKLAYLNERIALADQSISYMQKTLDLIRVQHDEGYVSALDLMNAEQNLAAQQADRTQFAQQKVETQTAFAILFDAPPETIKADPQLLPADDPPLLAAGLPSSLLDRRPDIRAAEMRLRETLADADATRASYLPSLSLTGNMGSSSVALTQILANPVGALGVGVALPFLNWFDARNNIAVSEAEYEQAVVSFRQTLYSAFADVENALSAQTQYNAQWQKRKVASVKATEAEKLYALRYREGYTALQDWLDAQEKVRTAKASVLESHYTRLTSAATLYEALGGGI